MARRLAAIVIGVVLLMGLAVPALAGWEEYEDTILIQGPCPYGWWKGTLISTEYSGSIYATVTVKTWYVGLTKYWQQKQYRVKEWRKYSGCKNYNAAWHYYTYHQTRVRTCQKFRTYTCTSWSSWQ